MAEMLKQGATLLETPCPACASPLFKLRSGDLWCAKCQKRVVIVKDGESLTGVNRSMFLSALESTILTKIQEIESEIKTKKDLESLQRLGSILSTFLESLERIGKMKRT
jgi:UPF0148 protein